jgi:hypothetical protein
MTKSAAPLPLIVSISPDYRLTADERQYVLQRRHSVDPTRSPWFNAETQSATIRYEWRDANGYYSLNAAGLSSAVQAVILRVVNDATESVTLAELLVAYQAEAARLSMLISTAMSPDLGALGVVGD